MSARHKAATKSMAMMADKYVLYEQSVQCASSEIDFVDQTFANIKGRKAITLREDFCGTANVSCEWVRRRRNNKAVSVDLDPQVLAWADKHNVAKLTAQQARRMQILNSNVMVVGGGSVDVVLAMNFSYFLFKQRPTMVAYFKTVYNSLAADGVFFLDAFGGYEAYRELEEIDEYDTFSYVWDQASFDPVTGYMQCHIHFIFKDGSRIDRAFSYDWRLWTLPEITEMLDEAGFEPTVYWEGTDPRSGEGDGNFVASTTGEADAGWIVYIVAGKRV